MVQKTFCFLSFFNFENGVLMQCFVVKTELPFVVCVERWKLFDGWIFLTAKFTEKENAKSAEM